MRLFFATIMEEQRPRLFSRMTFPFFLSLMVIDKKEADKK